MAAPDREKWEPPKVLCHRCLRRMVRVRFDRRQQLCEECEKLPVFPPPESVFTG